MNNDADTGMQTLINTVMGLGQLSAPRGKPVKELLAVSVQIDMLHPLVTRPSRNLGYRFAPAEAAWILSGDNRVATIEQYSKFIWEFSDDRVFYRGAYGPKVVDQLTHVIEAIVEDRDTRQAVINIWRENPAKSKDIPCTLSYQFFLRDNYLHVVQTMRSSDCWLGYPYDVFNASMLAGYVALLLRRRGITAGMGSHTMNIGSAHVYEKDWAIAKEFVEDRRRLFDYESFDPLRMFNDPQDLINHLWRLAAQQWDNVATNTDRWLTAGLREVSKSKAGENL